MPQRNIKKILFGIILLVLAGASTLAAFYFLEAKPGIPLGLAQVLGQKQEPLAQKGEVPAPGTVTAAAPANSSEKKEGFLWVDRKSSRLVATLGTNNGVQPGKYLTVYDGAKRVGQVTVEESFATISYVHPVEESSGFPKNDFYRVVIE